MDIQNMHPFCLPFGLCHDATSSSLTHLELAADSFDGNLKEKLVTRSKTSSPSDELFRQLSDTCSLDGNSRSLFSDDSLVLVGPSSPLRLDEATDDVFRFSLELHSSPRRSFSELHDENDRLAEDEDEEEEKDVVDSDIKNDWLTSCQYALLSPTSRKRKKSLMNRRHNSVFQHIVDPIDIKSSPTLAQLNLNASEDPTDGLWGTAGRTNSSNSTSIALPSRGGQLSCSLSSSSLPGAPTISSTNNIDLLSNCTSINRSSHGGATLSSLCNGNNLATCNHLKRLSQHNHHNHRHHHRNHTQQPSADFSLGHQHHSGSSLCQHVHQHQPGFVQPCAHSPAQSTCLAVAPYRKQPAQSQLDQCPHSENLLHCCHGPDMALHNPSSRLLGPASPLSPVVQHQNTCKSTSSPLTSQLNQRLTLNPVSIGGADETACDQHHRASSPALVTSSSSPHAITSSEPRSKLKENIEYLTALLCNGTSKTEQPSQQQQLQQPVSSVARSYTTLAHTLSTGPKLLERSLFPDSNIDNNNGIPAAHNHSGPQLQQHRIANQTCLLEPATIQCVSTNEAVPFVDANMNSPVGIGRQAAFSMNGSANPNEQWFKSAVESSVSAADSTESQVVTTFAGRTTDSTIQSTNHCQQQLVFPVLSMNPAANPNQPAGKNSDVSLLSSLLNANKGHAIGCSQSSFSHQHNNNNYETGWPSNQNARLRVGSATEMQRICTPVADQAEQQQDTPIPINGKPITLTPLNTSIIQPKTSRSSVFVQPASPSASSTASGASGELTTASSAGLSTSSATTPKKVKLSQQAASSRQAKGAYRSVRPNSMSTDCSISSHDEGFSPQMDNDECGSTRDSNEEDDVDSDDESFYGDYTNSDLIGASISDNADNKWTLNMGRSRRNGQKRYFWQYNVQSKGPKGTRICPTDNPEDPFVLPEASDPVFSNDCQIEGVKHSGKARRGDGNDLTPNPRKLLMIGLELKKLSKIINDLAPVTDLPLNARNKTRKEKNKLASRACRLKKKAQHEANKIKLYGLQREHKQVVSAIYDVRKLLNEAIARMPSESNERVSPRVNQIAEGCVMKIAGETSNYVNEVLEKVVSGCIDGGLQT